MLEEQLETNHNGVKEAVNGQPLEASQWSAGPGDPEGAYFQSLSGDPAGARVHRGDPAGARVRQRQGDPTGAQQQAVNGQQVEA